MRLVQPRDNRKTGAGSCLNLFMSLWYDWEGFDQGTMRVGVRDLEWRVVDDEVKAGRQRCGQPTVFLYQSANSILVRLHEHW